MKRLIWLLILFVPFVIKAEGISNYRIDATVMDNGDLLVKEAFSLDGSYNGFERIIDYRNSSLKKFDGSKEAFNGSDIYNGSDIELVQIRAVSNIKEDFSSLSSSGDKFTLDENAIKGDYGVYQETATSDGKSYLIYNPSSYNKDFYIEYKIKNLAVVHNDIAEMGWNIFTTLAEDVLKLEVVVNLPNNSKELRVWAHGPLTGNIDIESKQKFVLTLNGLYANEAIDTRFVFDKDYIVNPVKVSGVEALSKIVEVETVKADQANKERERLQKMFLIRKALFNGSNIVFILLALFAIVNYYLKHDREVKTSFNQKYFREFPSEFSPATVGYLFHKKIRSEDLSASILDLINEKVIESKQEKKKDYLFTYKDKEHELTKQQEKVIKILFSSKDEITLSELKKYAKKHYSTFLSRFNNWKDEALDEAEKNDFFDESRPLAKYMFLFIMGMCLGVLSMVMGFYLIGFISLLLGLIGTLYVALSFKRTETGALEYAKWQALKNFLKDFSIIDKRELPEVNLWGKYMVYAITLGCADKLAKAMEVRIKDFNSNDYAFNTYSATNFAMVNSFNNVVTSSINSAIASARSAENVANSASSSGGGFGGGFSSGGGGFGGGGGGGRF